MNPPTILPELVDIVLKSLRLRNDLIAGRAIAAVLKGFDPGVITDAEARAALEDYVVPGNAELTYRALRAGRIALENKLETAVVHPALAGELIGALAALDLGDVRGIATPAKTRLRKGASLQAELARYLAIAVAFEQAHDDDVSIDAALMNVTGFKRDGSLAGPAPRFPAMSWRKFQRLREDGERALGPEGVQSAKDEGEKARQGGAIDPELEAYLAERRAQFANQKAHLHLLGGKSTTK